MTTTEAAEAWREVDPEYTGVGSPYEGVGALPEGETKLFGDTWWHRAEGGRLFIEEVGVGAAQGQAQCPAGCTAVQLNNGKWICLDASKLRADGTYPPDAICSGTPTPPTITQADCANGQPNAQAFQDRSGYTVPPMTQCIDNPCPDNAPRDMQGNCCPPGQTVNAAGKCVTPSLSAQPGNTTGLIIGGVVVAAVATAGVLAYKGKKDGEKAHPKKHGASEMTPGMKKGLTYGIGAVATLGIMAAVIAAASGTAQAAPASSSSSGNGGGGSGGGGTGPGTHQQGGVVFNSEWNAEPMGVQIDQGRLYYGVLPVDPAKLAQSTLADLTSQLALDGWDVINIYMPGQVIPDHGLQLKNEAGTAVMRKDNQAPIAGSPFANTGVPPTTVNPGEVHVVAYRTGVAVPGDPTITVYSQTAGA